MVHDLAVPAGQDDEIPIVDTNLMHSRLVLGNRRDPGIAFMRAIRLHYEHICNRIDAYFLSCYLLLRLCYR